jgi:predicted RecA/RadA family phage recombinase
MSTNFIQPGKTMPYTAPVGGVTSGSGYLIGALFVVATATVAAGSEFQGHTEGVFTLPKTASEGAWVEGQPVFWDVANGKTSLDPTFGLPIGTVAAAALTGDTTGSVRLNGTSLAGRLLTIRKRFTTAQVNAGATLLAALPGIKYRMVDAFAIAVGGAMTANTTADIVSTLSSSRKLVAFAQAGMTQSTLIRAGAASGAILADGASFTANDAGVPVTVSNTGSAITTMTHLDVHFTYSLEG